MGPARLDDVADRSGDRRNRAATAYGDFVAADLAAGFAERDVAVISGGAYGIDGAAHRAALAADGFTVAVLAGGIDVLSRRSFRPVPSHRHARPTRHRVPAGPAARPASVPDAQPPRRGVGWGHGRSRGRCRSGAASTAAWAGRWADRVRGAWSGHLVGVRRLPCLLRDGATW